jgi:hypothetical protein
MATGWLRGKVKEVVSGDTLVLTANVKSDAPQAEKRLTLSSLIAPKLVTVLDAAAVGPVQASWRAVEHAGQTRWVQP